MTLEISEEYRPKILVVGYTRLNQLVNTILPEFEAKAKFRFIDYVVSDRSEIQRDLANFQPDVVVSAGANATYLKSILDIPVLSVQVTESDIVDAITKAAKLGDQLLLISFSNRPKVIDHLQRSLSVNIDFYSYSTFHEAREHFYLANQKQYSAVVSASFICGLANESGLKSFLFYSQESCRATLSRAINAGKNYRGQRFAASLSRWFFEQSDIPALILDADASLLRSNKAAMEQIGGKVLQDEVVPHLGRDGQQSDGELNVSGGPIRFSHSPIDVGGGQPGRLVTFGVGEPAQEREQSDTSGFDLVYVSEEMAAIHEQAGRYASTTSCVLITGETGTGKELIARELHRQSEYRDGPFVVVNCGAIPDELFEGELFGYVDGAFTNSRRGGNKGLIRSAANGVFFLDEIGELKLSQQPKLLRFLQERKVRPLGANREVAVPVKVVAATNKPLNQLVDGGKFREDLFYRLNVFNIFVSPLRERKEDIRPLAESFIARYASRYRIAVRQDTLWSAVADSVLAYHWPGNVRELESFMERAVVNWPLHNSAAKIGAALPQLFPEMFAGVADAPKAGALKQREREVIQDAMRRYGNDKSKVAEHLGISQTTLWRRLKQWEQA